MLLPRLLVVLLRKMIWQRKGGVFFSPPPFCPREERAAVSNDGSFEGHRRNARGPNKFLTCFFG